MIGDLKKKKDERRELQGRRKSKHYIEKTSLGIKRTKPQI